MEILKPGNLALATCKECECEFSYKQGEVKTDYLAFARRKYVWCPCCSSRVVIDIQYY